MDAHALKVTTPVLFHAKKTQQKQSELPFAVKADCRHDGKTESLSGGKGYTMRKHVHFAVQPFSVDALVAACSGVWGLGGFVRGCLSVVTGFGVGKPGACASGTGTPASFLEPPGP